MKNGGLKSLFTIAVAILLLQPIFIFAQKRNKRSNNNSQLSQSIARSKAALISLSKQYKTSLENVLVFRESEVKRLAQLEDQHQQLFQLGTISRQQLEQSQRLLLDEKLKLASVKKQLVEADLMITEAEALDELLKSTPVGHYSVSASLIKFNGAKDQGIMQVTAIKAFFQEKFGRQLPISAFGQSATHDRLGFNHRHAIDVAIDPGSREGQALIEFLRSAGISFIAFRHAVPGASTGAHIHIGRPSSRM